MLLAVSVAVSVPELVSDSATVVLLELMVVVSVGSTPVPDGSTPVPEGPEGKMPVPEGSERVGNTPVPDSDGRAPVPDWDTEGKMPDSEMRLKVGNVSDSEADTVSEGIPKEIVPEGTTPVPVPVPSSDESVTTVVDVTDSKLIVMTLVVSGREEVGSATSLLSEVLDAEGKPEVHWASLYLVIVSITKSTTIALVLVTRLRATPRHAHARA